MKTLLRTVTILICTILVGFSPSNNVYADDQRHQDGVYDNIYDLWHDIKKDEPKKKQYTEEEIEALDNKTNELKELVKEFIDEQLGDKKQEPDLPNYHDYDD